MRIKTSVLILITLLAVTSCQSESNIGLLIKTVPSEVHLESKTTEDIKNSNYQKLMQTASDVSYQFDPSRINDNERIKMIKLAAVGDLMVHRTQLIYADNGSEFDFNDSFEYITPYISDADYAFANLETTFAGYLGQRRINVEKFYKGYSGYPCFNTPDVFANNIVDAGFDFVSTANNHTFDSKIDGITRTLEILDAVGLEHTGSYLTEEDAHTDCIIEIDGVSFGIINYTYGLNGFALTESEDYMINHLDMYDETRIAMMNDKVSTLSESVDFMVVMLHYGNEYRLEPDNYYQMPMIDGLFDAGADIILAGHPHVLQPIEVREIHRSNGETETGVVIYSMGNFLSSQRSMYNDGSPTDIGMIFNVVIEQVDDETPKITEIGFITTFTHWNDKGIQVIPTAEPPTDLAYTTYDVAQLDRANGEMTELLMSMTEGEFIVRNGYYSYQIEE